jgi:hypothetical protein
MRNAASLGMEQGRLPHRMVRLIRGVEGAGQELVRQALAAGGDQGGEVGQRAAAGEDAARRRGVPRHGGEPGEHVGLQLRECRRRGEHPDVAVDAVGDQVGDRRVRQSAAGDVGEVAGAGGIEGLRHRPLEQQLKDLGERRRPLRQRLDQGAGQGGATLDVGGGLARQRIEVRRDTVHGRLHQAAQLGARELEGAAARPRGGGPGPGRLRRTLAHRSIAPQD